MRNFLISLLILLTASSAFAYGSGGCDQYAKLLTHADGTDASTSFVEEGCSSASKTISVNGNAQIDTAQSKFGGASGLFDGSGDYLTVADSADWAFGSGDFTQDLWVRFNALPASGSYQSFVAQNVDANNYQEFYIANYSGTYALEFYSYSGAVEVVYVTGDITPSINTWYHYAVTRSGNSWRVFADGTQVGATVTDSSSLPDFAASLTVGIIGTTTDPFNGWLDEIRISKGIARWTSNFTPPSTPYCQGCEMTQMFD